MAMKEIVLDISPSGKVEGMHFDEFPLGFLGPMTIGRASEIFHNQDTQQWDVVLPGHEVAHPVASGFSGYDVARQFEVVWLQESRKAGVEPTSLEGLVIALKDRDDTNSKDGRDDEAYLQYYVGHFDACAERTRIEKENRYNRDVLGQNNEGDPIGGDYGGVHNVSCETMQVHDSDCSLHNEPAYPNGPCDCSVSVASDGS